MSHSKARLFLAIAFAVLALPCLIATPSALAVSGSITDVHHFAGGKVTATYTTNYDLCTDPDSCFWYSTAYYFRAAHKCTPNSRAELAYVGDTHETPGSETKRDHFYPIYSGSIRICLYVEGLFETHFLAQALTRGRPPSPPGPARIAFSRACYREFGRVHLKGRGFEKYDTLDVFSPGPDSVIGANASGRFAFNFDAPSISNRWPPPPKQKRVWVGVRGMQLYDIPARSARGSFLVTTLTVATSPSLPLYGDIPRRVRYRLSGFKRGPQIYAHWRHNGHSSGKQRLGRARGPCGELRSAKLAFRERVDGPGRWKIQFDQHKAYSPRSEPKTSLEFQIVRTFLRFPSPLAVTLRSSYGMPG